MSTLAEIQGRVDKMLNRIGPTLYEKTDLSRWTQEQLLRDLEELSSYLRELYPTRPQDADQAGATP